LLDPWYVGGANKVSLQHAQENYSRFGVSEKKFENNVKGVLPGDVRDKSWRPVADTDRKHVTTPTALQEKMPEGKWPWYYWELTEKLVICPMPSLISTLLNREKIKGSPLTEAEVIDIRDGCPSVAVPIDVVEKIDAERGYKDINPERCWEEWQEARRQLGAEWGLGSEKSC